MGDFFISIDELQTLIGTADAPAIFDVCRATMYAEQDRTIPTAVWRDHTRVDDWIGEITYGQHVVVSCVHGHNVSQLAVADLRRRGVRAQALSGGFVGWLAAGAPSVLKSALPNRDEMRASRWVTRIRPRIDRVACPWLIRRFIDQGAEFFFVEPEYVGDVASELGAIPFDVPDLPFTHRGPSSTFDTLIRDFGLEVPALAALQVIIRGADTAKPELAPESAGLLALSFGNAVLSGGNDHEALERGFPIYDALYAWQRYAAGERDHRASVA